ncbi:MAG: DUF3343 domain-containing protein [Bacillota bacterium]|nr:DUF3343 domain-containing protein [Bacillota bacterium]
MEKYYLLTFENTISAMSAEEVIKNEKIKLVIMPTPTYITKSCGISIRILENDFDKIKNLKNNNRIKIKAVYLREENKYNLISDL